MKNNIGMPIKFSKDDSKFANDLSFMTEESWGEYTARRKAKEDEQIKQLIERIEKRSTEDEKNFKIARENFQKKS